MKTPDEADAKLALWDDSYDPRYVAELMAEMQRRGLNPAQARARAKSELVDAGNPLEDACELIAKAETLMKGKPLSHEYLDEAWAEARKLLPAWAWNQIHRAAMPRAGARAATHRREDEPSTFEKLALTDIEPSKLRELPDEELRMAWLRLHQWYANAKRARRPIENYVNAALWTMDEMSRRGIEVERDDELVRAIEELRGKRSSVDSFAKLRELPMDLVVVRDFVSVVGSTAKGTKAPEDLDILLRAPWDQKNDQISIQAENVWLPVRNVLDPGKTDKLHWIANPQGAHGDNIPLYDLVLRRHEKLAAQVVKSVPEARKLLDDAIKLNASVISGQTPLTAEAISQVNIMLTTAREELGTEKAEKSADSKPMKVDLGCGSSKPDGYIGIDKVPGPCVDRVTDLEAGIPLADGCADEVRASHFLEHVADKERIMRDVYRVLKPGGRFVFEVPSTKGEGAFAHPAHKSWWNKSSFAFWTQDELLEDRPRYEVESLEEEQREDLCYVRGVLRKPAKESVAKALRPFGGFIPPKPEVPLATELFETDELWEWAEERLPVYVEPKHNGFRAIIEKQGARSRMWFEGARRDVMDRFPGLRETVGKLEGDVILDVDVAISKGGKRLPRPELMRLNREKPELAEGEKLELTVFDLPYRGEDLSSKPFSERRKKLQSFFAAELKGQDVFKLSPAKLVKTRAQLNEATRWAFEQDRSEGLVAKSSSGTYELDGSTNEWSKLKRVAELKVIVLDVERTKDGAYTYRGGLLPGDLNIENLEEYGGKKYVDLGRTFSSKVKAKPGDILTVQVLELIPDDEKGTLVWLGPTVVDVDSARKQPYAAAQALDIATRAKVLQKREAQVPSIGRVGAKVLFVGSSPGPQEAARREPFVGDAGATLRELYIQPLGLTRGDVALTNVVPMLLRDDAGRVREPTEAESKEWSEWLSGELERLKPHVVVALGNVARQALGDRADVWMPHPSAVRRFGDSGEVSRKLRRVREMLREPARKARVEKQPPRGEGGEETRGFTAFQSWERTWQDQLPPSGTGRYILQHHWRGLDEKLAKTASDEQLLNTDHSLHGDIRLEGQDGKLWGWAIFLGSAKDNRAVGGDKLLAMDKGKLPQDKLQAGNKLPQPSEWLDVGVGKPLIVEPGGVGATANTWSKFFAIDRGKYRLGVARQHMVELWLDGEHLDGRYLLQFAPVGDRRVWLIDKPTDQRPMAETKQLADVAGEVKRRGQKYLFWGLPGERPQRIDVRSGKVLKSIVVPLLKERALEDKRIVYGVVLDPYIIDAHNDWISPNDVEETAHGWFLGSRLVTLHHKTHADAKAVESSIVDYPSRRDYAAARTGEQHRAWRRKFGDDVVHSGAWILGVQLSPELWDAYKRDEIAAFSIEGFGVRSQTTTRAMPKVQFVDLVEAKK